MYVNVGDRVILIEADSPELKRFIGSKGVVISAQYTYHPALAHVLFKPNFRCDVYVSYLEVIPPEESPFTYEEKVRVISEFNDKGKTRLHKCNRELVGRVGQIRGYDKRSENYLIKCPDNDKGWFPANCLVPISYKGSRFYYPAEAVKFKGLSRVIDQVKRTKNNYGQLLLIDGDWIPASDVMPSEKI